MNDPPEWDGTRDPRWQQVWAEIGPSVIGTRVMVQVTMDGEEYVAVHYVDRRRHRFDTAIAALERCVAALDRALRADTAMDYGEGL